MTTPIQSAKGIPPSEYRAHLERHYPDPVKPHPGALVLLWVVVFWITVSVLFFAGMSAMRWREPVAVPNFKHHH